MSDYQNHTIQITSSIINLQAELSTDLDSVYTNNPLCDESRFIVTEPNDTDLPTAPFWSTILGTVVLLVGELTIKVLPKETPSPMHVALAQQDAPDEAELHWYVIEGNLGEPVYVAAMDKTHAARVYSQKTGATVFASDVSDGPAQT